MSSFETFVNEELPRRITVGDGLLESIAVPIDPTAGVDPTDVFVIRNQASADALGTIKTVQALLDRLPPHIAFNVFFDFVAGAHVTPTDFGDMARFSFGGIPASINKTQVGAFVFRAGAGTLVQVPATTTYAVASATQQSLTLSVDSSFTLNQFRRYFLRVVSGPGVGEIKAIRSHTAAFSVFQIAGHWATVPTSSSVVEVVEAAASITLPAITTLRTGASAQLNNLFPNVRFDAIDVNGGIIIIEGAKVQLEGGSRFLGAAITADNVHILLGDVIFDGLGTAGTGITASLGCYLRTISSSNSWIIGDYAADGILMTSAAGSNNHVLFLFEGAIDDNGGNGVQLIGDSTRFGWPGSFLTGAGNGGFGVKVAQGVEMQVDTSDAILANALTGAAGDFSFDGQTLTWEQVDAAGDLIGAQTSFLAAV